MATTLRIPWNDGNGNIVLTYNGQGNDTVTVSSDTDNVGYDRQQQITFVVQDGAIRHTIASSQGNRFRTSNGNYLRSLDNSMKVTVLVIQPTGMRVIVTADDNRLRSSEGHVLRCLSST
jgi:hypothetical protein